MTEINGHEFSWASIGIDILEKRFTGFTAIEYADRIEAPWVYGDGGEPRTDTRGKYICDNIKLTGFKDELAALRAALAAQSASGKAYGSVIIPVIVVQFVEDAVPGDPASVDRSHKVELIRCRWLVNSESASESTDPMTEPIELSCKKIKRNGLGLWETR